MSRGYLRIRFGLIATEEDELVADLWSLGCLGTETREQPNGGLVLEAWFPSEAGDADGLGRYQATSPSVRELSREVIPARDWMAGYRAGAQPRAVGKRLLVDPREPERGDQATAGRSGPLDSSAGRHLLRIPAREAFGTGSHASTRLVLEMLEELDLADLRVLDVGAGSGILSFSAELFGAAFVVGVELDLVATFMAGQNRGLNGLAPSFVAGTLEALATGAGSAGVDFDLAVVNVLPFRIRPHLPLIAALLAPGAKAVFSGIPGEEAADLVEDLRRLGLRLRTRRSEDEWVALGMVVSESPTGNGVVG